MFKFLSKLIKRADTDDKSATQRSVEKLAKDNKDIIRSFRLSVTMRPRVSLKLLRRHGEIRKTIPKDDANLSPDDAIWLPVLDEKFKFSSKGAEIWSPAGNIPTDGAEVLQYLIALREIVEAPLPQPLDDLTEALLRLEKIKSLPRGPQYKTNGDGRKVRSEVMVDYFPMFFRDDERALRLLLTEFSAPSYDGLSYDHILELHAKGYNSVNEILNATDEVLLSLKGVGKKKLDKIRENLLSSCNDENIS